MDYTVVKDNLCTRLWFKFIEGVYIPKTGEKVVYFPQGHIEQDASYHQQESNFGLPWKLLCLVIDVQYQVHVNTDELFAVVTLIPLKQQDFIVEANHQLVDDSPGKEVYSFSKTLTSTEASTRDAVLYVPREDADRCFPSLDMTVQPPMQDLVMKDLHGIEWNFRHIYCDQQRAHFLTNGWSTFVNSKNLVSGDSCIFIRGEDDEIGIGIRRAMRQHSGIWQTSSPLGPASHAFFAGTMFLVQYYPWNTPFGFMIPLKTYVESVGREYFIGTRVRMSEVEGLERRYGTIVGNEDIDPIRWPGSEWRCIKVQWDSIPPNTSKQFERVCPWWIEPLESSKIMGLPSLPLSNKGNSNKDDYHIDMEVKGQQHYNTRNDENSIFFIFGFFILLCFFIFVIFVFRPLL